MKVSVRVSYTVHLDLPDPCKLILSDVDTPSYRRDNGDEPVYLINLRVRNGGVEGQYARENKDGMASRQLRRLGYRRPDQVDALLTKVGYDGLMKVLDEADQRAYDTAEGFIDFAVRDFKRQEI